MLVKCRFVMEGPGPSEVVVEVRVADGFEEVMLQSGSVKDNALEVGKVLGTRDGLSLVELPRESASGKWRVWVPNSEILQTA